ncbi:hypothetical protein HY989_03810 [Candidatus Micrarchaeota archaeon]|nr:hypothetical protein [Candidatus Micrarchaeota archaeon]
MARQVEIPKNIHDFLDQHEQLGFHFMAYPTKSGPVKLENLVSILRMAIISPKKAQEIEKKIGKKIFDIDPKRGKDHLGEQMGQKTYYRGFVRQPSLIGTLHVKAALRAHVTSTEKLPGLLFSMPGLRYRLNDKNEEDLSTHKLILSKFILAVVLPDLGKNERQRWLAQIRPFNKPVYDHDGKLVWNPHEKKE